MTHAPQSKRRSRAAIGCAGVVALWLTPTLIHAAATPSAPPEAPSLGPLIALFLFVLALIPVALWLLKRLHPTASHAGAGLKVITQLPLGPGQRERIVVLEAGDRWLLLGVTATSIQRIGTLPKGETPPEATSVASFKSVLQRIKS